MKNFGGGQHRQNQSHEKLVQAANAYNKDQYPVALRLADEAIKLNPANWQALKLRGLLATKFGRAAEALGFFKRVLQYQKDEETQLMAGEYSWRAGDYDQAIRLLEEFLARHPGHGQALIQLGLVYERTECHVEAEAKFAAAVASAPSLVDGWNNLGHVQRQQGKHEQALKSWERALALDPESVSVLDNLAAHYASDVNGLDRAIDYLQQGVRIEASAQRCFHVAVFLRKSGRIEESLDYYQRAIALDPQFGDAYNDLGYLFFQNGMMPDAERLFRSALACDPERAAYLTNLGASLGVQGRNSEAEVLLRHSIDNDPNYAMAYHFLALVFATTGRPAEAMALERDALRLQPIYPEASAQLAALLGDAGDTAAALAQYAEANAMERNDAIRVLMATLIPPIMGTRAEIEASRHRVDASLDALLADDSLQCSTDDLSLVTESGFYFAFHGLDDREILGKLSATLRKACPELNWVSPHVGEARGDHKKVRVGFVSKFLFNHSVGVAYNPIIKALAARDDLEIGLVSLGHSQALDSTHVELVNATTYYLPLPDASLVNARNAIADMRFDVLVFPDLGMSSYGNFLAHFRMAPVQCCFNGHPDTSGISTMDYRFSWDSPVEAAEAEGHYTEKLVRLKYGGLFLPSPKTVGIEFSRQTVGLSEKRAYAVPAKLQKFHPDFDELIGRILQADLEGEVILFMDETYSSWGEMLKRRFEKTIPDAEIRDRVRFSPWLSGPMFSSMLLHADILLDPLHFGLGTTAFLANSLGIPMVTLPGQFLRSRALAGVYELLGVTDTVAHSEEEYVQMAISLAKDPARRNEIGTRIRDGLSTFKAEADGRVVDELADALICVAQKHQ